MAEVSLPPLPKKDDQTDDTTTSASTSLLPPKPAATVLPPKPAAKKEPEPEERPYFDPYTRRFIFTDPKKQAEYEKGRVEGYKGVASGAAQPVVGVGQFAARKTGADALENYLAETQKTLKNYGSPVGQKIGELGTYLYGGRLLGGVLSGIELLGGELLGGELLGEELLGGSGSESLAPYIPRASSLVPETVKRGYRWLAGTAPETEAAVAEAAPETEAAVAEAAPTVAEAKQKLTWAQEALKGLKEGVIFTGKELGKGTVTGGAIGAGSGAIEPRTEETREKRDQARWEAIISGLKYGMVFGGSAALIGTFLEGANKTWSAMSLTEQKTAVEKAEELLEQQQETASKLAREAIQRETDKMTEAEKVKTKAEEALNPTEKKIQELTRAKREAELSPLVREQEGRNVRNIEQVREAMDPRFMEKLQENIPEKLRLQRDEAKRVAKQTGMTKEQAEAYVAEHERISESAAAYADEVADSFARRPTMTANELAEEIQPRVEKMQKNLEAHVKQNSGYSELEKKYGPQVDENGKVIKPAPTIVPVRPIINKINELLQTTSSKEVRTFLIDKKNLLEQYGSDGKITFSLMDNVRKDINDAVGSGIQAMGGISKSAAGTQVERLGGLKEVADKAMFDAVPEMEETLNKYAKLKKPLDPFGEGGVFEGVAERRYGTDFKKAEGDVLTQILNRTRKGQEGLDALIANNKDLQDSVRQYLNGELFGASAESAAKVTSAKFDAFKKRYGEVIDRAGLSEEFDNLASLRKDAEQKIQEAKEKLSGVKEEAKANVGMRQEAESEVERQNRLLDLQAKRAAAIREGKPLTGVGLEPRTAELPVAKEPSGPPLPTEKEMASAAAKRVGEARARLKRREKLLEEAAAPLRKTVKDATKKWDKAETARDKFETLQSLVDSTPTEKLGTTLQGFLTTLRRANPRALPKAQFDSLLDDIEKASAEYERSGKALKYAQDLRTYALTRSATILGLSTLTGGYGAYRVGRGEGE